MADADVAQRMFDARQALESRERARLTLDELGRRIAEAEEGRANDEPYAAAVVKRWLEGDSEPRSMSTWRAIASVFGVRVGWLANGELPIQDDPPGDNEGGQSVRTPTPPKPKPPIKFMRASDAHPLPRSPQVQKRRRKGG